MGEEGTDWTAGNRHHAFQRTQLQMFHRALWRARRPDTELVVASGDFNVSRGSPLYPMADGRSTFLSDHLGLRAEVTLPGPQRE